jgi:1-acyl-sn-glycerol-3-phosphate acyltransferase
MTPNALWRLTASTLGFVVFGVATLFWLPVHAGLALLPWFPVRRQAWARGAVRVWFLMFLHVLRGLGICTWDVKGTLKLGREGQLVISNHPMFLDIMFLLALIPGANCVIKSSLRGNPFIALPIKATGYLANDSAQTMLDGATAALGRGETLVMFPEGTRTVPGEPIVFRRGAANVAVKAAKVVTPVVLTCTPLTFTKGLPWYRVPARKWHFSVKVGEDIDLNAFRAKGDFPIASRRLNEYLQRYFEQELRANAVS